MNNDNDIFLKQMKGVRPIKKNNRIKNEDPKINYKTIKKKTTNQTTSKNIISKKTSTNKSYDLEKIDIRKNIKKKSFIIDKKIDFHGKTLFESEEIFENVILSCYNSGLRCLLFVTGKGLFKSKNIEHNNKPKLYYGVIRSAFINWVKSNKFSKYILSFEEASITHGGSGAFYVYLRKKKN